jgi:glycosyltransferase involved in cell wall biosynthesis
VAFRVAVAGENFRQMPAEFEAARGWLGERIIHWGFAPRRADYARLLWDADVVVSTALHEFFGVAVVEAIYCGCLPLLPRRLSYPELIPAKWHASCLYDGFEDLVGRLCRVLEERASAPPTLRQAASRFDWGNVAPVYDALLEEVAQAGHAPLFTANS